MAPKDLRQDDGGGGGGAGGGTATAGKRTLTQGIVQKKDALDLTYHPTEPTYVSGDVEKFRAAVERGDRDGAIQQWVNIKAADRIKWSKGATIETDLDQCRRVVGTYLLQIMEDTGLTFAARPALLQTILKDKSAKNDWLAGLARREPLWNDFLDTLPDRDTMTDDDARAVGKIMLAEDGMHAVKNTMDVVKKLFAYVYAPLRDDSYAPDRWRVQPWKIEWVKRLYKILSTTLPVQHVRSVQDFAVASEEKPPGAATWRPLGYGYWSGGGRHVILNESSAKDGGTLDHNMSGGGARGGRAIDHFDATALHEVGHGVGQELGGNAWARAHPWIGWQTAMTEDEWSKGLWGSDGDMKQRVWDKLGPKADVLDASEARKYLAHRIANKPYAVTTPGFARTKDVEAFIRKHYADQKLTKYWERIMGGDDRNDVFSFRGNANIGDDDRVYVYLSRNNAALTSYNAEAYRKRISMYSLSSPIEWFAEQYAHYYRKTPHGDGLEADTKAKLDELHGKKYGDPVAAAGAPNPLDAAASAGTEDAGDRLPFPW